MITLHIEIILKGHFRSLKKLKHFDFLVQKLKLNLTGPYLEITEIKIVFGLLQTFGNLKKHL